MRIICPTCASHYEVEADKIGATGQLVRCAQCREVWLVSADDDAPARGLVPAQPETRHDKERHDKDPPAFAPTRDGERSAETIDFATARSRLRRRGAATALAPRSSSLHLVAIGAACAAAMSLVLGFRAAVVHHVPVLAPAYAALGLPVNVEGLAIRDLRSVVSTEGDKTVLSLEGTIANLRDEPSGVPNITVVVRDGAAVPLYTWTTAPPKQRLAKGETVTFHSRLDEPPAEGRDVRVSFANAVSMHTAAR